MKLKYFLAVILFLGLVSNSSLPVFSQKNVDTFEKVELIIPKGEKINVTSVRLIFLENDLQIVAASDGKILKTFKYADILEAEYSYSKSPRWKTGLGLGAASVLFPPLLLVAIPLGFSKHRKHWLTFRSGDDYALLKLSKQNRKLLLPAFETKTGVNIKALGEEK